MLHRYLLAVVVWVGGLQACTECTDCVPFSEEPYVQVRFYYPADSSRHYLIFDSVNSIPASGLRHFRDTTYAYKFPLDMHRDSSVFRLVYRDTAAGSPLRSGLVRVWYQRSFVRRADNYIVVQCLLDSLATDLGPYALKCRENPDSTCISHEATVSIYF